MFLTRILGATNGWTGGQYSLLRFVFGTYLAVHFAHLVPWGSEVFSSAGVLPASASPLFAYFPGAFWVCDAAIFAQALLAAAALLSVLLALGVKDRWAAVALWWIWASLFARDPLISNPGLPYVGWMLLAHAVLPTGPYGSVEGATDPQKWATWKMPQAIHIAAWIVLAAGYSYSGYTKLVSPSWLDGTAVRLVLESPLARPGPFRDWLLSWPSFFFAPLTYGALALELCFMPLALFRRARPIVWTALMVMHLVLIVLVDFADLSLGMVMIHLLTFDPGWIRAKTGGKLTLLYDGTCGLCHGFVRFVVSEDRLGDVNFAPLVNAASCKSLMLLTDDGRTLTASDAVLHLFERLGGLWRIFGSLALRIPQTWRDRAYRLVAAHRSFFFAAPPQLCPVMPTSLRARFLDGSLVHTQASPQ